MRCERAYCGHDVVIHRREFAGSSRTCERCPCPRPIIDGAALGETKRAAVQTEVLFDVVAIEAELAVDAAREGGDQTVEVMTRNGRRVDDSESERDIILATFEHSPAHADRLRRARAIAYKLATRADRNDNTVTVAEVRDEFVRAWGANGWADDNGSTYWAGAIFRDRETWEPCGMTKSPYNHNDSNRIWKLKGATPRSSSSSEASSNEARSSGASPKAHDGSTA